MWNWLQRGLLALSRQHTRVARLLPVRVPAGIAGPVDQLTCELAYPCGVVSGGPEGVVRIVPIAGRYVPVVAKPCRRLLVANRGFPVDSSPSLCTIVYWCVVVSALSLFVVLLLLIISR